MKTKPADRTVVACQEHGQAKWLGDVVCEACGRVFLRDEKGTYRDVPETGKCICGVDLFPPKAEAVLQAAPAYFSARVCCRPCAIREQARQAAETS